MHSRRRVQVQYLDQWHIGRRRYQVIHEAAAEQLAVRAVRDLLEQSRSGALRHSAHRLAVDDHGVDHDAAVLRDHVTADADGTASGIDLHLAHVRRVRVRGLFRVVRDLDVELFCCELRQAQACRLAVHQDLRFADRQVLDRLVEPVCRRLEDRLAQLGGSAMGGGGGGD